MASSGSFNTNAYNGRYLTFSWSVASQSIANNLSVIKWTLKGAGGDSTWYRSGNFKVIINGTQVYYSSNRIELSNGTIVASGQFTINHNSDGNKTFSASAEAGIYTVVVNVSGSGSWALPQIARQATITNAPNFTDIQNPTITYSNPAGSNVTSLKACISLTGAKDDIAYRNIPTTGNSYTFNLTDAERNVLRNASKNSNTLSVKFYVTTVIGGQTYYSTLNKTMTIVNANPTISSVAYEDTNSNTIAITGNNQIIIRNNSTLEFNISTLAALKYATLTSIGVTLNNVSKSVNLSGTSVSSINIDMGTVNSSMGLVAEITLTDSRGNTTTRECDVNIVDWSLPSAIITCQRQNNYYSETDILVNGEVSSLNGKNTMTITYKCKKASDTSYTVTGTLQDNVTSTISLDNNYEWNIQVIVSDLIGSTTYNLEVDRGIPIVFVDRIKSSVGINCFPQNENSLEVNGLDVNALSDTGWKTGTTSTVGNIALGLNISNVIVSAVWVTDSNNQWLVSFPFMDQYGQWYAKVIGQSATPTYAINTSIKYRVYYKTIA